MALGWASADLLSRFNTLAARPATDAVTDATKYSFLAQGQREVFNDLALRVPEALFGAPAALIPASDSKTFTFPSSAYPVGPTELYPSLAAIPDNPLIEGVDFLAEADQIRIPADRSYSGTIYARYIPTPSDIDASTEPALVPTQARELIVYKAVELFGERGGLRVALSDRMRVRYAEALTKWLLYWQLQYDGQGTGAANRAVMDPNAWYVHSPDLG